MPFSFYSWTNPVSGSFNTAANWTPQTVPAGINAIAALTVAGAAYTVTSSVSNTVNTLELASNATLDATAGTFDVSGYGVNQGTIEVGSGAALELGTTGSSGVGITNEGTISLNGGASNATAAKLVIDGRYCNLNDNGALTLSNSAYNWIIGGSTTQTVQLENSANTITGAGQIGDAYLTFVNAGNGTVDANDSTALKIVGSIGTINTSNPTDENDGLMETTGAGGLVIDADMYDGGQILADGSGGLIFGVGSATASPTINGAGVVAAETSGAKIYLEDANVSVETISTVAGSTITTVANTTNSIASSALENNGTLVVANGSTLDLNASVENAGAILLIGSSAATDLLVYGNGAQLLSGGKVVLSNSTNNLIGSAASAATNGAQFTNNDNIIEGAGTIGDANLRFVNLNGATVNSDQSAGLTLVGDTNTKLAVAYNDGLIANTGAGGLTMENSWSNAGTIAEDSATSALDLTNFSNTGGGGYYEDNIAGGVINLTNANLGHSTLKTVSGSSVNVTSGETSTIDDQVFNHGAINVDSATLVGGQANYYNYGTINLEGSGTASTLELNGGLELLGGGDLVLENSAGNSILTNGSAQTFTNHDNTISGFGTIGDTNMYFQNDISGTVDANATSALTIDEGDNQDDNAGLLESTNTGGLTVQGNLENQGKLESSAGNLDVTGNVNGYGESIISGAGSIEFGGYVYQDVAFTAGGTNETLILDHSSQYAPNEIYNFGVSDYLDLRDIQDTSLITPTLSYGSTLNTGTLTVTDGTHTANLYMVGNYSNLSFSLSSDLHGGTLVSFVST